jgi:protein TonB
MPGRPGVWGGSGEVRGGVQILDLIDTGKLLAPSPPPQPAPQPLRRIWVGGDLQQARAIYQPQPAYPRLALQAHITGVVRLAAVISARGTIEELRVIDGPALLIDAAVEAVRQWRYRPLVLNGVPYEVDTRIEVRFVLN